MDVFDRYLQAVNAFRSHLTPEFARKITALNINYLMVVPGFEPGTILDLDHSHNNTLTFIIYYQLDSTHFVSRLVLVATKIGNEIHIDLRTLTNQKDHDRICEKAAYMLSKNCGLYPPVEEVPPQEKETSSSMMVTLAGLVAMVQPMMGTNPFEDLPGWDSDDRQNEADFVIL